MRRFQALSGLMLLAMAGQAHVTAPSRQSDPVAGTYRLRPGDTLARVAKQTGVAVDALAKANGITDPNRVYAGRVLTIPKQGEPAPVVAAAPAPLPSPVVVVGAGTVHRVGPGETLSAIAKRVGTSVADLAKANGIQNPNLIREGRELQVPGPAWICPVQGRHQFADSWGQLREGGRRHLGVDIFALRGTPVVASVGGTVEHVTGQRAGNAYYLRGDDGVTYYGAHLDAFAAAGRVERGAVIGTVGSTGNAKGTTPHLHFEIKPGGGEPVNPYPTVKHWC